MGKKPTVSERISIKNSLSYIKCVLRLSWVVHAPFYGLYSKRSSLYIKVYQGWGLHRSGPTDPPKVNGRKFAPTASVASKSRLGNRRQFSFPFVILLQDAFAPRANQRSQISATFHSLSVQRHLEARSRMERRTIACYLVGILRRLEPLERIYGRFPLVDPSGRFAGVPNLGKPLYRENTVYSTTH